jgi:hypothetical protein
MKATCKICKKQIQTNDISILWSFGKEHYQKEHPEQYAESKRGKKNLNMFKIEA